MGSIFPILSESIHVSQKDIVNDIPKERTSGNIDNPCSRFCFRWFPRGSEIVVRTFWLRSSLLPPSVGSEGFFRHRRILLHCLSSSSTVSGRYPNVYVIFGWQQIAWPAPPPFWTSYVRSIFLSLANVRFSFSFQVAIAVDRWVQLSLHFKSDRCLCFSVI